MRHQKAGRKFGRNATHRKAMFRNLAGNLVLHERLETTDAKAKELRRIAERLLTKAIRLGDLLTTDVGKLKTAQEREAVIAKRVHAQRLVASFLPKTMTATRSDGSTEEVNLVHKLFHDIAPRYIERAKAGQGGGYTRITKALLRRGDNAPISVIEFVPTESVPAPSKPVKKAPSKKTTEEGTSAPAKAKSAAASEKPSKKASSKAASGAAKEAGEAPAKKA